MELVARKADLVRELQFFQQIVERKNTIPILANVLLEATGNECTLLATDLEVALRSRCEAAVSQTRFGDAAGEEVLRSCSRAARWRREHRNRQGRHRASRSRAGSSARRCRRCPARIFRACRKPAAAPRPPSRASRCADGDQDAVCDHRRRHAVLPQRRPVRAEAGATMTFVATDGHRLALVNIKHDGKKGDEIKAILPRKTLAELGTAAGRRRRRRAVRARREPSVF